MQGPTSYAVLKRMGLEGIETAKPFDIRHFPFHGDTLMVSRTGFTGDLGYELWIKPELGIQLWDELYAAGEDFGIQPFGEAATNMARLEAAFIMPAMEFNEALKTVNLNHDQTPFELNLGWLVDFKKPHFSGRAALLEEKRRGPTYTLTKLDIEGNRPAEGAFIYGNKRCTREVGYVTSAMWSPAVKANIALAMIETKHLRWRTLGGDQLRERTAALSSRRALHAQGQALLDAGTSASDATTRVLDVLPTDEHRIGDGPEHRRRAHCPVSPRAETPLQRPGRTGSRSSKEMMKKNS